MKGRFKSLSRFNANTNFYTSFDYAPIKHSLSENNHQQIFSKVQLLRV
jgi:hypothetical protein